MPVERFSPDDPREWLNRARSSLAKARSVQYVPEIYLEDLCFDAQQAAEKAVKAVLICIKPCALTLQPLVGRLCV
ncbi:MAG: HEPN domain-containing protein [Anaerolineae bacterium]|nr:HEPN domain-containing protein [Anaerolineae bacterium]